MKIHPLMMDPEEKGDYHDGHLPTRWIVFIPNCPGPMVIQYVVWFLYSRLILSFCFQFLSCLSVPACTPERARTYFLFTQLCAMRTFL